MASETTYSAPKTALGRTKRRISELANDHIRLLLLGPTLVVLVVIFVYPVAFLVWSSLHRTLGFGIGTEFAPAYNYQQMATDPAFWNAVEKTLVYSFGSLLLTMAVGLAVALALDKVEIGRAHV